MSVLVDTSVWVAHFKSSNPQLISLIGLDLVRQHPMVILELACGTPPARQQTLHDMNLLQAVKQANFNEVLLLIEREKLYGLGCGLVDLTLLASTLITPNARLWTLDKRLNSLAARFGVAYQSN